MLWLGLFFPHLPLEVFLRTVDHDSQAGASASARVAQRTNPRPPSGHRLPEGPQLAVCDRLRVLHASERATALGVHPGIKRATALALAPDLELLERNEALERDALRQLACWGLQFTPGVSLQMREPAATGRASAQDRGSGNTGLLLEVEPSLRLFGGRDALITRLKTGIAQLGFSVQLGCAPTATGAWLLALHRDGACAQNQAQLNARLAALPVGLLESAQPHLATFESIGAHTLKALVQLPRAGLARRFGKRLLDELDRAFGRQPEPRTWFETPAVFDARLELLAEVDNAQALLFGARRLIVQLGGWLAARRMGASAFELIGEHDDRPPTTLSVRLSDATRDIERLVALLRETLAVTRLDAPVHTLRLRCEDVSSLPDANAEMFPVPASAREGLGRLIERLQARLGRAQVQRLLLAPDHRPEAAYRIEAVDRLPRPSNAPRSTRVATNAATACEPLPSPGALPRPLWLFERTIALSERNNRPYWHGPLTLLAGPERIESGWWDDALVQRDYFIATDDSDALLWIYRERNPDAGGRPGWFMQGRFG